jgi:hypothetical protein
MPRTRQALTAGASDGLGNQKRILSSASGSSSVVTRTRSSVGERTESERSAPKKTTKARAAHILLRCINRIRAGLPQPANGFSCNVLDFGLERVRRFPHALRYGSGTDIEVRLDVVAELAHPFVFEIRCLDRPRDGSADRETDGAEDERMSFAKIGKGGLCLRKRRTRT